MKWFDMFWSEAVPKYIRFELCICFVFWNSITNYSIHIFVRFYRWIRSITVLPFKRQLAFIEAKCPMTSRNVIARWHLYPLTLFCTLDITKLINYRYSHVMNITIRTTLTSIIELEKNYFFLLQIVISYDYKLCRRLHYVVYCNLTRHVVSIIYYHKTVTKNICRSYADRILEGETRCKR